MRDTYLIFRNQLSMSLRSPLWMGAGLLQSLVYLVFFGPLLAGLPLGANSWQAYIPGLLRDVLLLVGRAVLLLAAAIAFGLRAIRRSPTISPSGRRIPDVVDIAPVRWPRSRTVSDMSRGR